MKTIYLDNAATTRLDPEVAEAMKLTELENYGNASSLHHKGEQAKKALENARKTIAKSIKAEPEEIIFTSGGTEANNFVIKGIASANKKKGNHIIISKIEHDCILNACKYLEEKGFDITYLDVDKEGFVKPETLKQAIRKETILISIIHGNNEIGTIQDLKTLYDIAKKHDVLFHTDACQSFTKTALDSSMADMITLNAHKIHGPKGIGALYMKKESNINIEPLFHGGGHEEGYRSGTENVPAAIGFAKAIEVAENTAEKDIKKMEQLRDNFIEQALKIPKTKLNGPEKKRLCNNANISFRFIEGESIIALLDNERICCSTGSACSSHTLDPSHVMMALEDDAERAHGSVRFSLSKYTTKEEIDFTIKILNKSIEKLRNISPITEGEENYVDRI